MRASVQPEIGVTWCLRRTYLSGLNAQWRAAQLLTVETDGERNGFGLPEFAVRDSLGAACFTVRDDTHVAHCAHGAEEVL